MCLHEMVENIARFCERKTCRFLQGATRRASCVERCEDFPLARTGARKQRFSISSKIRRRMRLPPRFLFPQEGQIGKRHFECIVRDKEFRLCPRSPIAFANLADAGAISFNVFQPVKEICQMRIALNGSTRHHVIIRQSLGQAPEGKYLDCMIEQADERASRQCILAMHDGIDERFAQSLWRIFPHVRTPQSMDFRSRAVQEIEILRDLGGLLQERTRKFLAPLEHRLRRPLEDRDLDGMHTGI